MVQSVYIPVNPNDALPNEGLFEGYSEDVIGVTIEGKKVEGYYRLKDKAFFAQNPKFGGNGQPKEIELYNVRWINEPAEAILLTKEDAEKIKALMDGIIEYNSDKMQDNHSKHSLSSLTLKAREIRQTLNK